MSSRFTAILKGIQSVMKSRKYATKPTAYREPHMNELPVPCEPWGPWYRRQQQFYSAHLYLGLTWWLFSLGMALYTDALLISFWGPPCAPAPMVDDDDYD